MLPLLRLFSLSFEGGDFGWYEKALTGGLYTAILVSDLRDRRHRHRSSAS